MESLVRLTRVSKDYGSDAGLVSALRDVSLTIGQGEFVAVVGASGSGKSTLMNILGCLDRPTRGSYELAGIDVGNRTNDGRALVRNRLIGFVFQGFNLLPRTTALENVELPLQYRGVPKTERRKRAMDALDAVGLGARVHHTPNQLSGGEQQRVAIARALATDPPLLLADEPTGNLDTRASYDLLALLQRLNRDRKITICLVTHENDIAACASRVIVVRDGKIQSDISQEPADAEALLAAQVARILPAEGSDVASPVGTQSERMGLGGPVPRTVYGVMILGLIGGGLAGLLYDSLVLDSTGPILPLVLGLLAEAFVGARYARRLAGRWLTNDQRARVALWYTVGVTALFSLLSGWLVLPGLPSSKLEVLEHLTKPLAFAVLVALVLAVGASALLRYLLLSLFTATVRPPSPRTHLARTP